MTEVPRSVPLSRVSRALYLPPSDRRGYDMGIRRRGQDDHMASVEAITRWHEAAETVVQRFQGLRDMPLDEAVETALMRTPGNFSREELTERMAASRDCLPEPGEGAGRERS